MAFWLLAVYFAVAAAAATGTTGLGSVDEQFAVWKNNLDVSTKKLSESRDKLNILLDGGQTDFASKIFQLGLVNSCFSAVHAAVAPTLAAPGDAKTFFDAITSHSSCPEAIYFLEKHKTAFSADTEFTERNYYLLRAKLQSQLLEQDEPDKVADEKMRIFSCLDLNDPLKPKSISEKIIFLAFLVLLPGIVFFGVYTLISLVYDRKRQRELAKQQ